FNNKIEKVTIIGGLSSYESVVMNPIYDTGLTKTFVAGALTAYDLPDLAAILAPVKLTLINMKDGQGNTIDIAQDNSEMETIRTAWKEKNADKNLQILNETSINSQFGYIIP